MRIEKIPFFKLPDSSHYDKIITKKNHSDRELTHRFKSRREPSTLSVS